MQYLWPFFFFNGHQDGNPHPHHAAPPSADPNLAAQYEAQKQQLADARQSTADALEKMEEQSELLKKERENMELKEEEREKAAEKLEEMQRETDRLLSEQQERDRKAEELRNYPLAPFQSEQIWRETPVHFGVAGPAGSGKSTFINTFRGLGARDHGAAFTSCDGDGTFAPNPYHFPNHAQALIWDLPGCSADHPKETYLKDIGAKYFNMMVLLVKDRPSEIDTNLIAELNTVNIPYMVVRGRIDDLEALDDDERLESVETIIKKMRAEAAARGIRNFFVISSRKKYRHRWDYSALEEYLAETVRVQLEAARAAAAASASSTSAAAGSSSSSTA